MDILDSSFRKVIFQEIMTPENWNRKAEIYHAIQIYREKQKDYINRSLLADYEKDTVQCMRKISSINMVRRIVSEKASIYRSSPERTLDNATDQENEQFDNLYLFGKYNRNLKYSNRYFKYLEQVHLQILPINGVIKPRVLPGYMLDVVPMSNDPEEGEIYIVPIRWDIGGSGAIWQNLTGINSFKHGSSDNINQHIADEDDDKLDIMRFAVWTKQYNFITNGKGQIIDPETDMPFGRGMTDADLISPVPGTNTFIDISDQKDGVYWVDRGLNMAQFAIEFGKILSDTAETNRAQSYAQGIISALEKPSSMTVGPAKHMFLKKNKNTPADKDPEFRFENPSPDLNASLDFLDRFLNYFLMGQDLDRSTMNSQGQSISFSSGIERFLHMLEKFEASQDDLDIYNEVEHRVFNATRHFNNVLQDADSFESGNMSGLKEKLKGGKIRDEVGFNIEFSEPGDIRTAKDIEDQQIKLRDNQLTTHTRALMKIHGVTEDGARDILEEIQKEGLMNLLGAGSPDFGDQQEN